MKQVMLFLVLSILSISFISAFNFQDERLPKLESDYVAPINYSLIPTVNSSDFWDDLDFPLASWLSTYNATYDAKADYPFLNNNFNGSGNFTTTGTGTFGDLIVDTNTLFVDKINNRVGIGTASPGSLLHINSAGADSTTLLTLESGINNLNEYNQILFKVIGGVNYGAIRSYVGQADDSYMSFLTTTDGGTLVRQMTIQHDGDVGIGTASPQRKLHIAGSGTSSIRLSDIGASNDTQVNAITEYYRGINTNRVGWAGFGSSYNDDYTIENQISGGDIILMPTATGKVGIGTTTPTHKLNVLGDLNVTGTSYLRDLIIEAENISVDNILSKSGNGIKLWDIMEINKEFTANDTVDSFLNMTKITSSGNAETGFGIGIDFFLENDTGDIMHTGAIVNELYVDYDYTDAFLVFYGRHNGIFTEHFRAKNLNLEVQGSISAGHVGANQISMSGSLITSTTGTVSFGGNDIDFDDATGDDVSFDIVSVTTSVELGDGNYIRYDTAGLVYGIFNGTDRIEQDLTATSNFYVLGYKNFIIENNLSADRGNFKSINVTGTSYLGTMDLTGGNITADYFIGGGSQLSGLSYPEFNTEGLVGYWTADGHAKDLSGEGNDGTLEGDTHYVGTMFGKGFEFDGDGDWVDVGTIDITGYTEMSLSGWINPTTADGASAGRIISVTYSGGDDIRIYWFSSVIYCSFDDGVVEQVSISLSDDDIFHHIACTYNGSELNFYLDGVAGTPDTSVDFDFAGADGATYFGQASGNYFNGTIDDVMIFNRSLSAEEIKRLYLKSIGKFSPIVFLDSVKIVGDLNVTGTSYLYGIAFTDVMGFWQFNNNQSVDSSIYGYDGSYIGNADAEEDVLELNGVGDGINFGDNLDPRLDDWTYSAWIKTSGSSEVIQIILLKGYSSTSSLSIFVDTNGKAKTEICAQDFGSDINSVGTTNIEDGNWHHIVGVFDRDGDSEIYVDGVREDFDSISSLSGEDLDWSYSLKIGYAEPGATYFNGTIDDVMIFKRVLEAQEIRQLYEQGNNRFVHTNNLFVDTIFFKDDKTINISYDGNYLRFDYGGTGTDVAYFSGNISALDYYTRTPSIQSYTGDFLDLLKSPIEMLNMEGKLKREVLTDIEKVSYSITDFSRPEQEDYPCIIIDDITGEEEEIMCHRTVYPHQIIMRETSLGGMAFTNKLLISELKQENQMLKEELCLRDRTYSWCDGGILPK